jgi:hypothetical protein
LAISYPVSIISIRIISFYSNRLHQDSLVEQKETDQDKVEMGHTVNLQIPIFFLLVIFYVNMNRSIFQALRFKRDRRFLAIGRADV